MNHIVLLGDSRLRQCRLCRRRPGCGPALREILPAGWRATLQARDGAVIAELAAQLERLPADASHLVASVGGNDALGEAALLDAKLTRWPSLGADHGCPRAVPFRLRAHARQALGLGLPLAVCTIYEPRFPEPVLRRLAATALTALNDVITREAFARGVDCIDLRIVCDEDADFANPIEPSVRGGAKIARAILGFGTRDASDFPACDHAVVPCP